MICGKCNVELEEQNTVFQYLGHELTHPVLKCPVCGQVYIPEELAKGKMHEIESILEEK